MRNSRARSSLRVRMAAALPIAVLLTALIHATAAAALLWTLTVTPATTRAGQSTTFTLTASNQIAGKLGCLKVYVTPSFAITAVGDASASNGGTWVASWLAKTVTVTAESNADRLSPGESVDFAVTATGQGQGLVLWDGTAYSTFDCSGLPLGDVVVLPIVVQSPAPTPTPTPMPTPTPAPTALSTLPPPTRPPSTSPVPTLPPPIDVSPSSTPSGSPRSTTAPTATLPPGSTPVPGADRGTPEPSDERPSGSPDASSSAGSASAQPSPGLVAPGATPNNTPGSPGFSDVLSVVRDRQGSGPEPVQAAGFGNLGGSVLMVGLPVLVFSVPGLLIILLVLLQVAGTAIWIPLVRRFRQPTQLAGPTGPVGTATTRRFRLGAWIPTNRR